MSGQQPLDLAQLERQKKKILALRAHYTIGLVHPSGTVSEHHVPPPLEPGSDEGEQHGDVPIRWVNGEPNVVKRYKDRGFVLYKDLAAADGESEKHDRWKAAIEARITQKVPLRGNIDTLYSSSVLQRRANSRAGSGAAGGMAFDVEAGEVVEDPKAKREILADRLAEAGVGNPLTEPEPTPKTTKKTSSRSKSSSEE